MFPESPRLHPLSHGGPLGPHSLQSHYGLQQLSPGEFRQRASSNASSIGRLSPIPAVPETDLQDSPWSPEDYQPGGYGSTNDRFNPDQLVDNIAESMKIRENGFLAPTSTSSSSVSSSNGVGQQQSSNSSGNSGPSNGTSNGYGLCQPPSYGSPYSIQSDFRSLGTGCGSTSSASSAASSNRASSGGLVRSPPQQQRILNGPPDLSPAPPPYSIATLQVFILLFHGLCISNYNLIYCRDCRLLKVFILCHLRRFNPWINSSSSTKHQRIIRVVYPSMVAFAPPPPIWAQVQI